MTIFGSTLIYLKRGNFGITKNPIILPKKEEDANIEEISSNNNNEINLAILNVNADDI